jgi:hypothetical protein
LKKLNFPGIPGERDGIPGKISREFPGIPGTDFPGLNPLESTHIIVLSSHSSAFVYYVNVLQNGMKGFHY